MYIMFSDTSNVVTLLRFNTICACKCFFVFAGYKVLLQDVPTTFLFWLDHWRKNQIITVLYEILLGVVVIIHLIQTVLLFKLLTINMFQFSNRIWFCRNFSMLMYDTDWCYNLYIFLSGDLFKFVVTNLCDDMNKYVAR